MDIFGGHVHVGMLGRHVCVDMLGRQACTWICWVGRHVRGYVG